MSSGLSTPTSQASTLANNSDIEDLLYRKDAINYLPASAVLEYIASTHSAAVYSYDLARDVGVGAISKALARRHAAVFDTQTRAGAGLNLLGRLSGGTSLEGANGNNVISAYTTPSGLAQMAPTLDLAPSPSPTSKLVLHIPTATHVGGSELILSPTLSPLSTFWALVPEHFTVILSATPQEIVDLAAASYSIANSHVIHLFDQYGAARELSVKTTPPQPNASPVLDTYTALSKAGYEYFDYAGDTEAQSVIVVLNGPLAVALKAIVAKIPSLGVVVVRVLRPWDEASFWRTVPTSATNLHVLDDLVSTSSFAPLYHDVLGTISIPQKGRPNAPKLSSHKITPEILSGILTSAPNLLGYISSITLLSWFVQPSIEPPSTLKRLLFFGPTEGPLSAAAALIAQPFLNNVGLNARLGTQVDEFSHPGGVSLSTLLLAPKSENITAPIGFNYSPSGIEVDFIAILEQDLVKTHDIFLHAKQNAAILVISSWAAHELLSYLSPASIQIAHERALRIYAFNINAVAGTLSKQGTSSSVDAILVQAAFWRLYLGALAKQEVVENILLASIGEKTFDVSVREIVAGGWNGVRLVPVTSQVVESAAATPAAPALKTFAFNTIQTSGPPVEEAHSIRVAKRTEAAKHVVFREAFGLTSTPEPQADDPYPLNPALRPDLPEDTFLVTCTVNRRLTPLEYNRNVFHLEFDTSGTGLKYAIGEALGVHGWNDTEEVYDFCSWYGLDPNEVLSIPVPDDPSKRHVRTVFQALQQQIDLFGKPPKSFYEALAGYATKKEDRMALRFISAAEGTSTFKKLSELETVTFADVLKRFESARPPIEVLCEIVGDIKPRHYSIASAQSAVGDRVDLLVVTVDWLTPSGSPRFGQCTRYLAGLKIGQKVTVSIKPSVMKLPPDNMQPIVMAGLGTGAAPFRAFMQHRAHLASQNIPVGPMLYYFGSRHRSEEYLYGEEIEAYLQEGIITHAGLAFSRDEKRKVYIQHKMLEDGKMLAGMLGQNTGQKGVFYLCGPTWPVPDVFEAIVGALREYDGLERKIAEDYIEGLKEEERYVLEVY